jgi:hypothetical protein
MLTLELVSERPNWTGALQVAMTRPAGVSERRSHEDPWTTPPPSRPRRISDDLSWLRAALDNPIAYGLSELDGTAAVAVWESGENSELRARLRRLEHRGVLDAAGLQFR